MRPATHRTLAVAAIAIGQALIAPTALADLAGEALRGRIAEFVRARTGDDAAEISVPALGDFSLEGVDPASVRVDLSTRATGRGSTSVPVSVVLSDAGHVLKRGVVTVRVRAERPVVVATRHIRRGEPIGPGDVRVERREARGLPAAHTSDPGDVIGMAAASSISLGQPVRTDRIERPAVVERGQRVRLRLESAQLRIEATGIALSKGAVGDTIRVRNADSRREVTGRIGADGAVHVAF